jgi:hypothetical protein
MKSPIWRTWWLMAFAVPFLVACGGGGDGAAPGSDISYSGLTSKAIVTDTNAAELTVTSYQGGNVGGSLGDSSLETLAATAAVESGPSAEGSHTFELVRVLKDVAGQVEIAPQAPVGVKATATNSMTIDGECGGSVTYTVSYDEQAGTMSGSMSFNDYCSGGVTLSGGSSFSGRIDPQTYQMVDFSFTFDRYTVASGDGSFSCSGSISYDMGSYPQTATVNMYMKDGATAAVYRLENYVMSMSDYGSYAEVSIISGNFYHPEYGYVSLATTTPLQIYFSDDWPFAGELVCTGEKGIAGGPTKARLTVISSTEYQIEADTDGDGTYDYNSGVLHWANI